MYLCTYQLPMGGQVSEVREALNTAQAELMNLQAEPGDSEVCHSGRLCALYRAAVAVFAGADRVQHAAAVAG